MLGDDCCGVALRVKAGCIVETGAPSTSMDEKGWKVSPLRSIVPCSVGKYTFPSHPFSQMVVGSISCKGQHCSEYIKHAALYYYMYVQNI